MNKITIYLVAFMGLVIIVLSSIIIFRKPVEKLVPFNEKPYKDSINLLINNTKILHIQNDSITKAYQDLDQQKLNVKIIYYAKYKFIKSATPSELDSIIRYNW